MLPCFELSGFCRSASLQQCVSSVQGSLKAMQVLHNDVGRSVDEAMRLLDAFQYVEENGVVRPPVLLSCRHLAW